MKTFTVKYVSDPFAVAFAGMDAAIKSKKPQLNEGVFFCDSVEGFVKVFSRPRLEAFEAISQKRPNSVYELAKILKKDESNVLRDVRSLEDLGLIRLKKGERGALKIEALYDGIVFEYLPQGMKKRAAAG